tara:strand:- start:345 stop:533 length:189 start_codon:yes stop_codon:yes gene_type:complete
MKKGDLVRVNSDITEYTDVMGCTPGVIVTTLTPHTCPVLFEVYWPSIGLFEKLYEDELEIIL